MTMLGMTKRLLLSAAVLAGLSGAVAAHAAPKQDLKGTNVVLAHGAFADGSSWSRVIPLLEARGLHVVAVQNPLSSLADDTAATRRAIDAQTGPVVLVGHSWAGVVISEAGNDAKVKSLVYVAAFAPDDGQSIADVTQGCPRPRGPASCARTRPASRRCRTARSRRTSRRTCRPQRARSRRRRGRGTEAAFRRR
jgi:pimeloyl-ACP methyl ester carboxylesterase